MRLEQIRNYLDSLEIKYQYSENDDCGGIEFILRGISYHIWEYPEPERGASSNVRNGGRMEDFEDNYEESIISVMESWDLHCY